MKENNLCSLEEGMKAVVINKFGTSEVLEVVKDHPIPSIDDNQVLLKVKAASVNALDWKIRRGMLKMILGADFPVVLGNDAAGIVVQCGEKVSKFKPGDRVYCMLDANSYASKNGFAKSGAYAEYAVTREDTLALMPEVLSYEEAAALPLCSLTAYQALIHKAKIKRSNKVLINGASGGVGIYAVQIAKLIGASVTAVCGPNGIETVEALGADIVIDYTKSDITKLQESFDVIYDIVASTSYKKVKGQLSDNGMFISNIAPPIVFIFPFLQKFRLSKRHTYAWVKPSGKDLKKIATLVNKGLVKPVIEKVFSLDNIREAHEYCESGKIVGKIALKVG
jgi:2-desacetyl-2-hydroxyethyl bacteriochlorophyllide A dehydrogenase